ncbi:MAG: uroporphyrinogen decarboxylase [Acidobacteriota bacterium]|jgi:uroporphyrinogen decarboxylase|nr:uroporphyrinogen decarboxylase [Acidobacteriota bacterium]
MNDRFLKACRREKTDRPPVWFMRQAGRYMKSYRAVRERHGLMEMFKDPDLAAEVTLQPVRAFALDAAIIFADILLPLEGMGVAFEFQEKRGPVMRAPVRTLADIAALRVAEPERDLGFVLESLRRVRAELEGKLPLIGFAGAPFTLAGYAVEGGSSPNHLRTKQLMYREPEAWDQLMGKLCDTVIAFLRAQVRAGAQAVQLFDSWVGCLSPSDYRRYVLPHSRRIFAALAEEGVPTVHFGTATAGLLPLMAEAGGDVIGADWRISLSEAWRAVGGAEVRGIQGNLDPVAMLAPWEVLRKEAQAVLDEAGGVPGHVFNLGHGLLPETPEDAVKALADFVHEHGGGSPG